MGYPGARHPGFIDPSNRSLGSCASLRSFYAIFTCELGTGKWAMRGNQSVTAHKQPYGCIRQNTEPDKRYDEPIRGALENGAGPRAAFGRFGGKSAGYRPSSHRRRNCNRVGALPTYKQSSRPRGRPGSRHNPSKYQIVDERQQRRAQWKR
jgi:hypothetical protein